MKVKKMTISFERTLQIDNYEPLKLTVSEEVELEKEEQGDSDTVKKIRRAKTKELFKDLVTEEKAIRKQYGKKK